MEILSTSKTMEVEIKIKVGIEEEGLKRIKNRGAVGRRQERGCCNDFFTLEIICCSSAVVPC